MTERVDGLLPRVAEALGLTFVSVLGGGEFGAAEVRDPADGAALVLKALPGVGWAPVFAAGAARSARVRAGCPGYPVPRYRGTGVVEEAGAAWSLQELLPGSVAAQVTPGLAARLVELVECHAGRAGDHGEPDPVGRRLAAELDGSVDRLRSQPDGAVGALADRLEGALLAPEGVAATRQEDVVHADFHHRNVLVAGDGDTVTAVFDWELAYDGDWRIDLVNLACWAQWVPDQFAPEATALLVAAAEEACPPPVLARFAALHSLRQLDFDLRVHPERLPLIQAAVEGTVVARGWV